MTGGEASLLGKLLDDGTGLRFRHQIHRGRRTVVPTQQLPRVEGPMEMTGAPAEQHDRVAGSQTLRPNKILQIIEEAYGSDHRRWKNGLFAGLVVERDVSRDHGNSECRGKHPQFREHNRRTVP